LGPDEITQLREIEYMLGKVLPVLDIEGFPYRDGRIVPFAGRPAKKKKTAAFGGRRGPSNRIARR